jgi:pimeloyl-ACP methyl ester carboxylesterase
MAHAPIAQLLAEGNITSILVDLPGFGSSTAPLVWSATIEQHARAVEAALDVMGIRRLALVGHSMGGSIALVLASRLQHRITSLVLAEPLLLSAQSTLARSIAKRPEADFVSRGYDMLVRATRRQAARGDRAAHTFLNPLLASSPVILHRSAVSLLADRTPSFSDLLRDCAVPTTFLVGERTAAISLVLPNHVRLVTIPDAGHAMFTENPEASARAIASAVSGDMLSGLA